MLTPTYRCTQQQLYTVSHLAIHSLQTYLAVFNIHSPRYQQSFIDAFQSNLQAAEALPGKNVLNAQLQVARLQLVTAAYNALVEWRFLELYIKDAYPTEQKPRLEQAGSTYYAKAANKNWRHVISLLNSANTFIQQNLDQLQANGNMPAAFATTFAAAKTQTEEFHKTFITLKANMIVHLQKKVVANNSVNKTLLRILIDGQLIFRNDPAVKRVFTLRQTLRLLRQTNTKKIAA